MVKMIDLKPFQKKIVNKLLSFTAPEYKVDELIIKSPTGSGKTVILLSWIDEYISSSNDNISFIWFTPGAGELEEQSLKKASNFSNIRAQSVDDALLNGFMSKTVTFINYERVIGKKSKIMLTDGEKDNLNDKIEKAFNENRHFILIIDEAHRNDTKKAQNVIEKFKAVKTVKISATINDPKTPDKIEFYEVTERAVIDSGLITKSVIVNEAVNIDLENINEFEILFEAAENKRKQIKKAYLDNNINEINPLVLVQLPDESTNNLTQKVEEYIENTLNKTYENCKLGIWLSNHKRNINNINQLDSSVQYLIIKQAIATGWDAPRAKILIKIRENMEEQFTIQTIGRIRRMPEPQIGHYENSLLDNAFLYTFDRVFLEGVFSEGAAVLPTPILHLKEKAEKFHLTSERVINQDKYLNEKLIIKNLFEGLKRELSLSEKFEENQSRFKSNGFILGSKILTTFKQGRFDTINNIDYLQNKERWIEADYQENRLDLLHAFHELDRVIHLPVSKVEAILKRFFLWKGYPTRNTLLKLNSNEWTAFVLNNWEVLRKIFKKIDIEQAIQGTFDIDNIKKNDFFIPKEERYTYNPVHKDVSIVQSNVYQGYTSSIISARPSFVEREMERWLERNRENINLDYVYKNGDKGPQYFSIVYSTNGGVSHFYPDFIIRVKSGETFIIETKGGETLNGQDKNIDEYTPAKYEALRQYAQVYDVKWAFVRDYDEKLYFLNTDRWINDMVSNEWKKLEKLFDI